MFIITITDDCDEITIGEQPFDTFDEAESDAYAILEECSTNSEYSICIYEVNETTPVNEYYWQIHKE